MAAALDPAVVLAPLMPALLPVPAQQPGICRHCRTAVSGIAPCVPCTRATAQLKDLPEVLPLAMSVHGEALHAMLFNYKRGWSEDVRRRSTLNLAAMLALALRRHRSCIGHFDAVTTVPSANGDRPKAIVSLIGELRDLHQPLEFVRGAPRVLDAGRYRAPDQFAGKRVLLIDDTFTSGASMYSAVAAVRAVGADEVIPLVVGRHLRPDFPDTAEMLRWLRACDWRPETCGRCAGAENPMPVQPLF